MSFVVLELSFIDIPLGEIIYPLSMHAPLLKGSFVAIPLREFIYPVVR